MPLLRLSLSLVAAAVLAAGCAREEPAPATGTLATGFWQALITLPGGDIDSGIEISHKNRGYTASLVDGQQRVPIDEVRFADGELLLRFPTYNNEIRARLVDGQLRGELVMTKRYGETQSMPFVAVHGAARKDSTMIAAHDVDVSGRWSVMFDEPDGSTSPAIGEFSQRGSRLFGTFITPAGDFRYLAGHVRGNELRLSTFDGGHAYLLSGEAEGNRIVRGQFWSGNEWHQGWSAVRNPQATLPDAYTRTWLKPGYERFKFSFPDLDGSSVSLDDARFDGKVVVVTLAGSWCPNCHDEARFIAPLYEKYRERGLEVVALMYEHLEDPAAAAEQVRLFRDKFGIRYPTLLAGLSSKTEAGATLPSLNAVLAFPTTIFIDRAGHVRRIYTGFRGPGTGEHHKKLTGELTALVEELLAEPAATVAAGDEATG